MEPSQPPSSSAGPLSGRRVLIARPRAEAEATRRKLEALGAAAVVHPAIEIGPPDDWGPVDAAIARLAEYDWLVFSSVSGVRFFLDRVLACGGDVRRLGGVRLAAIGPGTADALRAYSLQADLVPGAFRAEALAEALAQQPHSGAPPRYLLIRASRGREALAEGLEAAGGMVDQVVAYASRDVQQCDPAVAGDLAAGRIDYVLVTSSSIAAALVRLFGASLRRTRLVSISPITSGKLAELGYPPQLEAAQYTIDGMLEAMLGDA